MVSPKILAVGTAVPTAALGQQELAAILGYSDPLRRNFFLRSGIDRRHFFVDAGWARPDEDRMGFTFPGGRARVVLSKDVRRIAPAMMEEVASRLLKDHGLGREDVRFRALHSAGRRVIERAQAALGLAHGDLAFSRDILRRFGNMSSATVLFVLDEVLRSGRPRPGDWGLMIALGPGFAAEGALLRW
ncbi:MAG: hypothetical protein HY725_19065 [Candidatus Rokubacteria bacterium]|nr:hypothetical protein [Candidatus Rokubacteria bacterium]